MEKEVVIEYKPNIDTLVKVSKYLLFTASHLKWIILLLPLILLQNTIIPFFTESSKSVKWDIFDAFPLVIIVAIWFFVYFRLTSNIKKNLS
jgi:hypothetical protein